MFVWLVFRYGTRLQPSEWFAEVATLFEFFLDRDPDSYKLTDKLAEGGPFRVGTRGYRYRESRDQYGKQEAAAQPALVHDTTSIPEVAP